MVKSDAGEDATPVSGNTQSAAEGGDLVTQTLPEVEAGEGEFPDAVHRLDPIGLTQHILILALKYTNTRDMRYYFIILRVMLYAFRFIKTL